MRWWVCLLLAGISRNLLSGGTAGVQAPAARPRFEVVSVKPTDSTILQTKPTRSGGRITWTTDLWYLIGYAYDLPPSQISGVFPKNAPLYRIDAVTDPTAADAEVRQMLQTTLAERFGMIAHQSVREMDGYGLYLSKDGSKLQEITAGASPPPLPEWYRDASEANLHGQVTAIVLEAGVTAITGRAASMLQLSEALQRVLQRPVWDHTSLKGNYYFSFRFALLASSESDAPALSTALREGLGLRLQKEKGPAAMLIVDHIEKVPTPN